MGKLEEEVEVGNPQQAHCATVLLLDTSASMEGASITALAKGLAAFKEDVQGDDVASKRVDLAVVTFGREVRVAHQFSSIDEFSPPELTADGPALMGAGLLKAIAMIEGRKQQYRDIGTDYYRPWLFLITAGRPMDMTQGEESWSSVVQQVHEGEAAGKFMFFAVAVEQSGLDLLKEIAPPNRPPALLLSGRWGELFSWLSRSKVADSNAGKAANIESPKTAGWGELPG